MNWPGFLQASGAWLFLLLIPLIIFYFLKLKRPRLEIPSLALWRSVLNDQRVNSPFQRFKRNLLLLLQVLLLVCLALATMQPILPTGADNAEYVPILIDCSASMAALDAPGGISRLEAAKQEVGKLITNLLPGQKLSLISVTSTARSLTDFTDNRRVLRDALDQLEVVPVASRLEDALRMTQAIGRTKPIESVLLFTDGNVPGIVEFELPFSLNYQKLAPAGANIGITALNARRSRDQWDVFVRIDGSKSLPAGATVKGKADSPEADKPRPEAVTSATVNLLKNGKPAGEEIISLEPGESQRIVFHVQAEGSAHLEVRLTPEGFDSLASDDVAYLDLPAGRELTVYCDTDLASYRHALQGMKEVVLYPDADGKTSAPSFDLVISDKAADLEREALASVFTGFVPADLKHLVKIDESVAEVVDWQRSAPLLQHVLLAEVQIAEQPVTAENVRDRDFEELGYEILAQGRSGPLILRRDAGGRPQHYLLFHTDRSTLPYRVGFPILVSNAVQVAMQQAGLSESRGHATGMLPPQIVQPDVEFSISAPDGDVVEAKSNADGILSGVAAPEVGRYKIQQEGREVASVGISLLAGSESSLESVDRLQFPELAVGASTEMLKTDRPIWPWLAMAGFVLLLAEWWFFQRRPGSLFG